MSPYDGIDEIKKQISRAEYERAIAMLESVGEMERIARAVPYYGLYQTVVKHLRRSHKVGLDQIVLVSIDRGGRLPCIILRRALGLTEMYNIKVDQGGSQLDKDKLEDFAKNGTLRGKHILFVDSTVDSGRQIRVLERYFDSNTWRNQLGHSSWSIVGSNEYNESLDHHCNVNWGVDPDNTFEDNPELMGIDYGDDYTKVVERPTEASETIRRVLLSVPDGYIYVTADIDRQIEEQHKKWTEHQKNRRTEHDQQVAEGRAEHKKEIADFKEQQRRARVEEVEHRKRDRVERKLERIASSKKWKKLVADPISLPNESLPTSLTNGADHTHRNVLVVGSGKRVDLPQEAVRFVTDNLGPHCSFFAGTLGGNPGAILNVALASDKVTQPEVRLYQPGYMQDRADDSFGGAPVMFVGEDKDDMRRQMISDCDIVLVLGGAEGTLREVLIALDVSKPIVLIEGFGPVSAFVLSTKSLRERPNLRLCKNLAVAVQTILE